MSGETLGKRADNIGAMAVAAVTKNAALTAWLVVGAVIAIAWLAYANHQLSVKLAIEVAKNKDKMYINPYNNLNTGGMNPMWYSGQGDAGNGGPVHRETNARQVGAWHPGWRASAMRPHPAKGAPEHMHGGRRGVGRGGGGEDNSPCGPNEYLTEDGTTCMPLSPTPPDPSARCHTEWDPAASAEAMALATEGVYPHRTFAPHKFQRAVDAAMDSEQTALSDADLMHAMHHGGAP